MATAALPLHGQVDVDSTYTVSELNRMLRELQKTNNREDLAAVYFLLGLFEADNFTSSRGSLEYFNESKRYYKLLQDSAMVARLDKEIGEEYLKTGFFNEALQYLESSLDYYEAVDNLKMKTHLYYLISQVYEARVDPELELRYLNRAISLNQELGDTLLEIEFLMNKIKTYEVLNELDSAVLMSVEAVKLSDEMGDEESMSRSLYHLGYLSKIRSEYDLALRYLTSSEQFADKKAYSKHRSRIYDQLAECYDRIDDYQNAYRYRTKYAMLNDSILSNERAESLSNYAIKYNTDQKEKDIQLLEIDRQYAEIRNAQQRNLLYFLGGGLLLMLASLYYIINFYRQRIRSEEIISKQNQKISQQKIRELEDDLKISSMQSMLEGQENERERISKDLHDSLGGLLSTIKLQFDSVQAKLEDVAGLKEYKAANRMLDTAVEEVRAISQNLQPGSLSKLGLIPALNDLFNRFDEEVYPEIDFQYYDIPENIPTMISLSIYRIIQELLHNAIKHAQASEILIQINSENDELVIQFEDDGKGYDPENLKRKGMGLENIKSRVNYLKGQLHTITRPGDGTSTIIHIRYRQF